MYTLNVEIFIIINKLQNIFNAFFFGAWFCAWKSTLLRFELKYYQVTSNMCERGRERENIYKRDREKIYYGYII